MPPVLLPGPGLSPLGAARGGSAFDPLSLSPALWLKADAGLYTTSGGSTPATADGDPVGRWEDQSGNSRHLLQATAGLRPTLKLAIKNSRSVVRFDGLDDWMRASFTLNQPHTRFIVFKFRSTPAGGVGAVADGVAPFQYSVYVSGAFKILAGSYVGTQAFDTNWHAWRSQFNGASSKTQLDNGSIVTGDAGSANAGGLTLAAVYDNSYCAPIDVGEVLEFPSALSDANATLVFGYLNDRWAIY